jgi:hypothetical protein
METPDAIPLNNLIECYKADPHMTHAKWVQWAVDCAERVLPLFESARPSDARPRRALEAARAWAAAWVAARAWVADPSEKNRAARAAYAARAAADAAAYAAADPVYAAHAAADAAAAAAYAARAAAYAAATERLWQAVRLMEIYHG